MAFILSELRSCLQVGAEMGHYQLAFSNSGFCTEFGLQRKRSREVGVETPGRCPASKMLSIW